MVRNLPENTARRKAQREASLDLLSRDERFAVMRFVSKTDIDIGAAILGIGDEDEEMSADARRNYEMTVFG